MSFAGKLIRWQRRHGRRGLPWQGTRDPYRVWLAEIMLQQTQVATVVPYYERFLQSYPSVERLAAASEDDVLRLWSGLGYYARGRNLRLAAKEIIRRGGFPRSAAEIAELPGVGRSTAAAIAVFAFGDRAAILDGNVRRVLSRCYGITAAPDLWQQAERLLPGKNLETYTQALMDLGATVCTRNPNCGACPVKADCAARKTGRIHELPSPRARKPLPLRKATWFVHLHAGKVLLERRPSAGLWGGLWTFPEKRIAPSRGVSKLPVVEHGFTHFNLLAEPIVCHVSEPMESPGRRWICLARAANGAVPAPVRKVLRALRADKVIE